MLSIYQGISVTISRHSHGCPSRASPSRASQQGSFGVVLCFSWSLVANAASFGLAILLRNLVGWPSRAGSPRQPARGRKIGVSGISVPQAQRSECQLVEALWSPIYQL